MWVPLCDLKSVAFKHGELTCFYGVCEQNFTRSEGLETTDLGCLLLLGSKI